MASAIDRFLVKINKTKHCWIWSAAKFRNGYGCFARLGRSRLAHRISWEIHKGEIPRGLLVLHRCDNRPCVNPDHLFLGTHHDNNMDCIMKGRQVSGHVLGSKHGRCKLTEAAVLAMRNEYVPRIVSQATLAKKYCVTKSAIQAILERRRWGHI